MAAGACHRPSFRSATALPLLKAAFPAPSLPRAGCDNLTRSGLVLSSRPIDVALVGQLSPDNLQARAVLQEGGQTRGRLQARIANLAASGALVDRLFAGNLFAQLRFEGPADALW